MITVKNITKKFGEFIAVNNLSFQVASGDVVGFLGPNGAGKSTTMKMLTGFLECDAGNITVAGEDVSVDPISVRQRIGYLPEGAPAYGDMTPLQFLDFIADVRGITPDQKSQRIADVVEKVQLQSVLNKPIDNLSKGFKRRVGLAQAIIHDPQILILDEPTDGLDPNQKHQVRQLIQNLAKDKIVIVSTHILEEVTAVCNRVMIIANGEKCFDDTPDALLKHSRYYNAIHLRTEASVSEEFVKGLSGIVDWEITEGGTQLILFPEGKQNKVNDIQDAFANASIHITEFFVEQGRLDEVFRDITGAKAA